MSDQALQTDQTYAEAEGEKPFDWNAFLNGQEPTGEEWAYAAHLASSWVTCACGNQCAALPRHMNGEPLDEELEDLGSEFYTVIKDGDRPEAQRILAKIEQRSAYLLDRLD